MKKKVSEKDPSPGAKQENEHEPGKKRITFGEALPTYWEMVEMYTNEVRQRAKGNKHEITKLSGMKMGPFHHLLKRIGKKK